MLLERLAGDLAARWPGKPAARLLGPSARKARTNDRGSRAPTAPTWAVAHPPAPVSPGGLGRVQQGHGRPHPLPAPRDPGARHAGCGLCMPCKASGMRCKAGARGSTATMGRYPSLCRESGRAAPRPMCQASCRTSQLGLPPHSCPGTPSPSFGTGTAQMEQPETGSAAHPDADAQW